MAVRDFRNESEGRNAAAEEDGLVVAAGTFEDIEGDAAKSRQMVRQVGELGELETAEVEVFFEPSEILWGQNEIAPEAATDKRRGRQDAQSPTEHRTGGSFGFTQLDEVDLNGVNTIGQG